MGTKDKDAEWIEKSLNWISLAFFNLIHQYRDEFKSGTPSEFFGMFTSVCAQYAHQSAPTEEDARHHLHKCIEHGFDIAKLVEKAKVNQ